jgi:hypothetical protein
MPPHKIYRAAAPPMFTIVLIASVEWQNIVTISPYVVKFGVLALLGALVSGLMAKDGDIRGAVIKGCAAVILGSVLPMLVTMWDIDERICYILAFGIGLCIDAVMPALRKGFIEQVKKWLKVN